MPKKQTPLSVRACRWRNYTYYVAVPAHLRDGPATCTGKQYFKSKASAQEFVEKLKVRARNQALEIPSISPRLALDALEAARILEPLGRSLTEAAKFLAEHVEESGRSRPFNEVLAAMMQAKGRAGVSSRYLGDLRSKGGAFGRVFGVRAVSGITAEEVNGWLDGLAVTTGASRNAYRQTVGAVFGFAVKQGWATTNPVLASEKAKESEEEPEILTTAECRSLLEAAEQVAPEILPRVALCLFAGLRPESECDRLEWRHVNFEERDITILASRCKTARRRIVRMEPVLLAWLENFRGPRTGRVKPKNARKLMERAREEAGLERWPQDVMRHTFLSMHYARWDDAARTAAQAGHATTTMLFTTYRRLVTRQDAEAFWGLFPTTTTTPE